jgi:hypothetical protein
MPRLGELLVAAGTLTVAQVEQALRAQVMWGGRLGTNLIELGCIDLDALSKALGRQHKLPAALARHFERGDPALQANLSPDVAERFSVVPLLRGGPAREQIIIATTAALAAKPIAIIADELAIDPANVIVAIAAELRIRYFLERVYKIPRGTRFLRSRGQTAAPHPQFEVEPVPPDDSDVDLVLPTGDTPDQMQALPHPASGPLAPPAPVQLEPSEPPDAPFVIESTTAGRQDETSLDLFPAGERFDELGAEPLDDLSSLAVLEDDTLGVPDDELDDMLTGRERRRYIRTIVDEPGTESERHALARIAIRKIAVPTEVGTGNTLGEATRAIRRSTDRDRVAELVIDTIFRFSTSCEAAMLLVVRGDVAISWKGFCRSGATITELAVPLDQVGLVPQVVERNATLRCDADDLGPIDQLLMVSLAQQNGELVVVPVSIGGQVMCVIVMATAPNAQISSAESVAIAAGAAFARLMRDAAR